MNKTEVRIKKQRAYYRKKYGAAYLGDSIKLIKKIANI